VLAQAAERHRGRRESRAQPRGVEPGALPGQRRAVELEKAEEGRGFVTVEGRFGPALFVH
jgi:hypothetical protein